MRDFLKSYIILKECVSKLLKRKKLKKYKLYEYSWGLVYFKIEKEQETLFQVLGIVPFRRRHFEQYGYQFY